MTAEPTPLDLDELERLLGAATPGPWVHQRPPLGSGQLSSIVVPSLRAGSGPFPVAERMLGRDASLVDALMENASALVERARAADTAERTLAEISRAVDRLGEATEGEGRAGTMLWPDRHRDVYSLAIEEAQKVLHAALDEDRS